MSNYFKQSLQTGEEPLLLLRQHAATFAWPLLRAGLLLGITIPIWPYAFNYLWLTLVLVIWSILVLVWGILSWFTWYFNITLVTSRRVIGIMQRGPFTRRVREVTYDKIGEVNFQIKGLLATIFGFGNVEVYIAGQENPIIITAVSSPEVVKDKILKIQEYVNKKFQGEATDLTLTKLAKLLPASSGEQKIPVRVKSNK
jgi:membrane protein YdbS with pleckstrin-like domain